jgi:hypothetical protein
MQKRPINIAFFALFLLVTTLACNALNNIVATPTPFDVIPYPVTVPPAPTRDPSLPPRWIEFERALASVLLGTSGNITPDVSRDQGLCEWEFWGQKGEQVYVWAECINDAGTAVSAPAVIFLREDGHIKAVVMPQEGWGNIEDLFPDPVLPLIYGNAFDAEAAMQRLERRLKDPSIPPLIVEQGTEMPMPD